MPGRQVTAPFPVRRVAVLSLAAALLAGFGAQIWLQQRTVAAVPGQVAQLRGVAQAPVIQHPAVIPTPQLDGGAGQAAQDAAAGIRSRTVRYEGSGKLVVASKDSAGALPSGAAASARKVVRVRVEVEQGLPVSGPDFAGFVVRVLNDSRSWGRGGAMSFVGTSGNHFDIKVILASPATSRRLCVPEQTMGTLSCGVGNQAVLTWYRWVNGTRDYASDLNGYRQYLVNHEVGHLLGHGHENCPGKGAVAPVMVQQTKGLHGCRRNPWPYPGASA